MYHSLITDMWKYMKQYTETLPATDDDWIRMIDQGNELISKYPEIEKYATAMVEATTGELERIARFN